jgi:biopolymer transport protein TolR
MARTFRRHRQSAPISELNLTNLIDLGFVLLIIFMIATPLIHQEQTIPVNLPIESPSRQQPVDPETRFQTIAIDRSGNYYFGETRLSFADLNVRLAELSAETKPPVIRIRADFTLQYQEIVTLLDALKRHQLSKITFDTRTP